MGAKMSQYTTDAFPRPLIWATIRMRVTLAGRFAPLGVHRQTRFMSDDLVVIGGCRAERDNR